MNDSLHISQAGLDLIRQFEGLYLHAYYDSVHVLTIGYGHTNMDNVSPKVFPGMTITAEQAEEILQRSLAIHYEVAVKRIVTVPLTQHEFDALVSFCYNCGEGNLTRLVRKLNTGAYASIPSMLKLYTRAGGKVLNGLVRRRNAEAAMWSSQPYEHIVAAHVAAQVGVPITPAVVDAPVATQANVGTMPQQVDRPDELPDKVAKWSGALAPFATLAGAFTDWRIVVALCVTGLIAGAAYLYWRQKVKA